MRLRIGVVALGMGVMALSLMAAAQSAHRLVLVVGRPNDPRVTQQQAALQHDAAALRERDVTVQDMTPEAVRRERPELEVAAAATFEVILVGKDGGVKLRREEPVAASELTALIDTMPMRQSEMGRRR